MTASIDGNELASMNQTLLHEIDDAPADIDFCKGTKTISDISKIHIWLRVFLIVTGNHWSPDRHWTSVLCKIYYCVSRFAILGCAAVGFYLFYLTAADATSAGHSWQIAFIPIYGALFLASISVLPAQYFNGARVVSVLSDEELLSLNVSLDSAVNFAVVAMTTTIASIAVEAVTIGASNQYLFEFVLIVPHVFVTLALSYNMFFLMLDLHSSAAVLDNVHHLASKNIAFKRRIFARRES